MDIFLIILGSVKTKQGIQHYIPFPARHATISVAAQSSIYHGYGYGLHIYFFINIQQRPVNLQSFEIMCIMASWRRRVVRSAMMAADGGGWRRQWRSHQTVNISASTRFHLHFVL